MPLIQLREYGSTPRFHGNGFTQLPLMDSRRLHIWHPSIPQLPGHNATIHNHTWDLQSRVLLGSLVHRTYAQTRPISDDGPYDVHQVGDGCPAPITHMGQTDIRTTGEYNMASGSIYIFPAGELHESEPAYPDTVVATIMERRASPVHEGVRPLVLCPRGEAPVDAFAPEHQPSTEDMWAVIEEAVLAMSEHTRLELKSCLGS